MQGVSAAALCDSFLAPHVDRLSRDIVKTTLVLEFPMRALSIAAVRLALRELPVAPGGKAAGLVGTAGPDWVGRVGVQEWWEYMGGSEEVTEEVRRRLRVMREACTTRGKG